MDNLIPFRRRQETAIEQSASVAPILAVAPAPLPAPTRIKLFDGKVVLYKRPNYKNDYWQYAIPVGNGFEKKSTKTGDLEKATKIASDRYRDVLWHEDKGLSAAPTLFGNAALAWIGASEREIALGGKHVQLRTWIAVTKKHLIPFFGKRLVSRISQADVTAYHDDYLAKWQQRDFTKVHPKKPSATSMST